MNAARKQDDNVSSSVVEKLDGRLKNLEQANAELGKNLKDGIEDLKSEIQIPTDSISKLEANLADVEGANQVLKERLTILEQQV